MSTAKDSGDKILPYIINDLSSNELSAFKEQMEEDSELRKEVSLSQQIKLAVNDESLNELENKLKIVSEQYHQTRGSSSFFNRSLPRKTWLALAASVLVIIACFIWMFLQKSPMNAETLYAQYAKHDFSFTERGPENQLITAENFLDNGNYQNALPLLNEYITQNDKAADVILALGIANMEIGNNNEALSIFSQLQKDHPIFSNECKWYIALTHLKTGDLDQSIANLSTIESISNRYKEAQRLITEIQSFHK